MPFDVGFIRFEGKVVDGVGEAKEYLQMEEYRKKFKRKLEIDPSYGTLNLKLDDKNYRRLEQLKLREGIKIKGFRKNDEYYGGAETFPGEIKQLRCAVVIPEVTRYDHVLETVSNHYLRDELNLQEGDIIYVKVYVNMKKSWLDVNE